MGTGKTYRLRATAGAIGLFALVNAGSATGQGTLLAGGGAATAETLVAGQQLVLEGTSGPQAFAGHQISFEDFSGVLGYSSQTAYVVVIDGRAEAAGRSAKPGEMLLITPGSLRPDVAPFDAERFSASWPADARERLAPLHARLDEIADRQDLGLFIGRLGRTTLNVAAPGGARAEIERRNLTGDPVVQKLRFTANEAPEDRVRGVAASYLEALARGDARTLAALTDPVPYGNAAMTDVAADGRLAMVEHLVAARDWGALLRGATLGETGDAMRWTVSGPSLAATLLMRPMGDFVFVQGIELGDAQ